MQGILVLLQQLKSSLLNIWNILLSEPQLTPGRRSAMMVTRLFSKNWKTQPIRLWYAKKVKDIVLGTRMAGWVFNSRQLIRKATGVVRTNNPNLLKEYGGDLVLTDKWARGVLEKLTWSKCKSTTRKVDPSPQFLAEEKFTFQRNISALVSEHDIIPALIIKVDRTPLLYVNEGKYMFSFKNAKNIPVKGVDDKRQIAATFTVSFTGEFSPIQLIYAGKTKRSLPK